MHARADTADATRSHVALSPRGQRVTPVAPLSPRAPLSAPGSAHAPPRPALAMLEANTATRYVASCAVPCLWMVVSSTLILLNKHLMANVGA